MTERKSGMTDAQMEAILDEAFRVTMARYLKSKQKERQGEQQTTD